MKSGKVVPGLVTVTYVPKTLAYETIAEVVDEVRREYCGISDDQALVVIDDVALRDTPGQKGIQGVIFIRQSGADGYAMPGVGGDVVIQFGDIPARSIATAARRQSVGLP